MSIEQIAWSAVGLIVSMLGFFLMAFYKQVQKIGDDVATMRIGEATNSEKIKNVEKRVDFFEDFLRQNFKHKTNVA